MTSLRSSRCAFRSYIILIRYVMSLVCGITDCWVLKETHMNAKCTNDINISNYGITSIANSIKLLT
jgi:hypothetical protein